MSYRLLAYVYGPYTAPTKEGILENTRKAEEVGKKLALLGYAPFIPHKNTLHWQKDSRFTVEDFLSIDEAFIPFCDIAVSSTSDWSKSPGTIKDLEILHSNGIQVYTDIENVPPASELVVDCTSSLIRGLLARRIKGVSEYGEPLSIDNGRDALIDIHEEALDLAVYAEQALRERKETTA